MYCRTRNRPWYQPIDRGKSVTNHIAQRKRIGHGVLFLGMLSLLSTSALAEERAVKIAGFGAQSGVLRPFGANSEAAMRAAADVINKSGGVKLGDGAIGKIV